MFDVFPSIESIGGIKFGGNDWYFENQPTDFQFPKVSPINTTHNPTMLHCNRYKKGRVVVLVPAIEEEALALSGEPTKREIWGNFFKSVFECLAECDPTKCASTIIHRKGLLDHLPIVTEQFSATIPGFVPQEISVYQYNEDQKTPVSDSTKALSLLGHIPSTVVSPLTTSKSIVLIPSQNAIHLPDIVAIAEWLQKGNIHCLLWNGFTQNHISNISSVVKGASPVGLSCPIAL